jgi:hypothetical protein
LESIESDAEGMGAAVEFLELLAQGGEKACVTRRREGAKRFR